MSIKFVRASRSHWNCSKLADKLRGTTKPVALTLEGWAQWDDYAKSQHKHRFWLAERGLEIAQNIVYFPLDTLYSIECWYKNKYIMKTHLLSSPQLNSGSWYDLDYRILHCVFDSLVDFVEVECAWACTSYNKHNAAHFKVPRLWFKRRKWRSAEAGLLFLREQARDTDARLLPADEQALAEPTDWANAANEIINLYNWWVNCRDEKTSRDEENEMLIRLVKVRKYLWT